MQQVVRPSAAGFFAVLRTCIIASFVLLIAATALNFPPWVAMLGGGAPLVFYHLGYLTPRAKTGLSQTAIDSVYYFGFLVTVAALGVSAVSLAVSDGKAPLNNIAFQFGLGLLATGYAVLARMHLTSISTWVEEASPEAVLDRYVQRSRELVMNVEMASTQFVELSNNLMLKSQQVAETSRIATEKSMIEVARAFDEQMRGTLASARAGLTEIRGLVNDTSFVEEREALMRSVKVTLDTVTSLNKSLDEFAHRSSEGARTAEAVNAASGALNNTLSAFHANLEKIGGKDGSMLVSAQSLAEAQTTITGSAHAIGGALQELEHIGGTVAGIGLTFKSIKTLTAKANEQMEALVSSSERLGDATLHISKSAEASSALADGLDRIAAAFPLLQQRSASLEAGFEILTTSAATISKQLHSIPRPVEQVVNLSIELRGALEAVSSVIAKTNTDAQALAFHSASHAQSLTHAQHIASDIDTLRATSESVQRLLGNLVSTIEKLNSNLDTSAGSLKSALSAATTSLEADVKRSTDLVALFGERLTDVAQIIIDRTRNGRSQ